MLLADSPSLVASKQATLTATTTILTVWTRLKMMGQVAAAIVVSVASSIDSKN